MVVCLMEVNGVTPWHTNWFLNGLSSEQTRGLTCRDEPYILTHVQVLWGSAETMTDIIQEHRKIEYPKLR